MSLHRIKSEILADKKKASILSGLVAIALILGVRAMVSGKGGPASSARAATSSAAPGAQGAGADQSVDAEARVRELITRWRAFAHPSQAERDLFALSEADFPHPSEPEPITTEGAKSADQTDDETLRRQAIAQAVASITLKSTLVGEKPVAVMSIPSLTGRRDVLVRTGDSIAGFTVTRITQGRVSLEQDGMQAELVVKSPLE
jgi:hypothetical protein